MPLPPRGKEAAAKKTRWLPDSVTAPTESAFADLRTFNKWLHQEDTHRMLQSEVETKLHSDYFSERAREADEICQKIESGELRGGATPEPFKKELANNRGLYHLIADGTSTANRLRQEERLKVQERAKQDRLEHEQLQPKRVRAWDRNTVDRNPFHEPPSSTGSHPTVTSTLNTSSTLSSIPDASSTPLGSYQLGRHRVSQPTGRFGRAGGVLKGVTHTKPLGMTFREWEAAHSDSTTKSVSFDMAHLDGDKENEPPARDLPRVSPKQPLPKPAEPRALRAPTQEVGVLASRLARPSTIAKPLATSSSRVLRPVSPKQPGATHLTRTLLPTSSTEPVASRPTLYGRSAMQARVEDDHDASSYLHKTVKRNAARSPEPERSFRQASSSVPIKEQPQSTLHSFTMPTNASFPHLNALVGGTLKVTPCYKSPMSLFYQQSKIPDRQSPYQFLRRLPEDEADIFVSLDMILGEVASLKDHDEMLQQEADRLQQTVDTLQKEAGKLQETVDTLQQENEKLRSESADDRRELRASRGALRQALEMNRAHMDDSRALRELELENLRLNEAAKRQQQIVTDVEQHGLNLRLQMAAEKRENRSFRQKLAEAEKQAKDGEQRLRDLQQDNAQLQKKLEGHPTEGLPLQQGVVDRVMTGLQQKASDDAREIKDLKDEIWDLKHQRAVEDRIRRRVDRDSKQRQASPSSKKPQTGSSQSSVGDEETLSDQNMTSAFIVPDITLQTDKEAAATQSAAPPTRDDCHVLNADIFTLDGFDEAEFEMGEVVRAPVAASSSRVAPTLASAPVVASSSRAAPTLASAPAVPSSSRAAPISASALLVSDKHGASHPVLSHRRKRSAPADLDASRRVDISEEEVEEKPSARVGRPRSGSGPYLSVGARQVYGDICEHECRNCSVCSRVGVHGKHESCKITTTTTTTVKGKEPQKKHTLRIPRPTPVSDQDMPTTSRGSKPTVRPALPPGEALARVIKTIADEYDHIQLQIEASWGEYKTDSYGRRGHRGSRSLAIMARKALLLQRKQKQLYDLNAVLEGQKLAGQLMTNEEFEVTMTNILDQKLAADEEIYD